MLQTQLTRIRSVAVIHATLNTAGGGERVCLAVIEALLESNFDVTLFTAEKTDWNKLKNAFGTGRFDSDHFHESVPPIWSVRPRIFGVYHRMVTGICASILYSNKFDLVINTVGDINPIMCSLTYLHFPNFLSKRKDAEKYANNILWKLYFAPYALFQRFYYPYYLNHTTVLCNSRFTQQALKSHFPSCGDNILYPPFDLDRFDIGQDYYRHHTENIVVTCSRFVPEKNLQVIPIIASKLPEIEFHIFGGTNQYSGPVIEKILSEKQRLGCTNLHLHPDASTEELVSMYKRAKVYLHTMVNEHFGISIVEAMAAGLVPIVHRSGGAYLDIIEKDKYGFSYETPEEAAGIIKSVIEDSTKHREYSHAALDRSRLFTKERFKREFLKLVMN